MVRVSTINQVYRRGVTLIELLVVVSIIGTLAGLILPAVQAARESSRRSQCANNLKQWGLAIHGFHNSFNRLPTSESVPISAGSTDHGWMITALPYLEQQSMYDRYDFSKPWSDVANRPVVSVRFETMECPSSPTPERFDYAPPPATEPIAAVSDYGGVTHVDDRLVTAGLVDKAGLGAMPKKCAASFNYIRDGLSNSILMIESAGRPQIWRKGSAFSAPPTDRVNGGGWARPASDLALIGSSADGTSAVGPCAMNCTNGEAAGSAYPHPIYNTNGTGQFYSFHGDCVKALLADGSVHVLDEKMDIRMLARYVTRAGQEVCDSLKD
jgi:prepilin-type N-terminal cleavage/methylation domain-containing protein